MPLPDLSTSTPPGPSSFAVGPASAQHADVRETTGEFIDRRSSRLGDSRQLERRQFGSSHQGLSDAGRELALAIDQYKVEHSRRYLTCDEMLLVLSALGYAKTQVT